LTAETVFVPAGFTSFVNTLPVAVLGEASSVTLPVSATAVNVEVTVIATVAALDTWPV
jgi:hypothetical protein